MVQMIKNPAMWEMRVNPWGGKILWRMDVNPIQYSCLEISVDRGAWQVTVHDAGKD